ncbi:uncharacterized protein LOC132903338 [Amyelois transitella]|uniref:uncharacterized protein LOC132903338 n=1 Tax=Amyelois transitella TaxID=680683 RepID=UPI0029900E55|nr:uncharacterized protein LOC132903338 [Amyelois transitella]
MFTFNLSTWVIKNFVLHTLLSQKCEKLYFEINNAQIICIQLLNQDNLFDIIRVMCKNVIRLNKCQNYKLNLLGFFNIDAKFPLRFVGLLATHAVVLLQFALNK